MYIYIYTHIYILYIFWLYWVFIAAHGLSPAAATKGCLFLVVPRLLTEVALLLRSMYSRHTGSVIAARGLSNCSSQALELRLSFGTRSWLLHGMWNLHRPGIKPMSPALAGRLLSTVSLGKFIYSMFCKIPSRTCSSSLSSSILMYFSVK